MNEETEEEEDEDFDANTTSSDDDNSNAQNSPNGLPNELRQINRPQNNIFS